MLINLSNHPVASWSAEQVAEAERCYGAVEDMAFPNIPPEWSSEQVLALCNVVADAIQAKSCTAVHVMGEMTFTFGLVFRLHERGIPVVASTSERLVETYPDGRKLVVFRFKQFRPYTF